MSATALWQCRGREATDRRETAPLTATVPKTAPAPAASRPVRDLSIDESRGGHTLSRHVGKTDEDLRERLTNERGIMRVEYGSAAGAVKAFAADASAEERAALAADIARLVSASATWSEPTLARWVQENLRAAWVPESHADLAALRID